jgi:hypothetical protein
MARYGEIKRSQAKILKRWQSIHYHGRARKGPTISTSVYRGMRGYGVTACIGKSAGTGRILPSSRRCALGQGKTPSLAMQRAVNRLSKQFRFNQSMGLGPRGTRS